MTDKAKPTEKEKPRVRIGEKATELAESRAASGEAITAAHLEQAIIEQEATIAQLREAVAVLKRAPSAVSKTTIQNEFDQLYQELMAKLEAQHAENLNMFNGLRFMLNVYGSEQGGDDVEGLIKSTNDWLDRTIKPIAKSQAEARKEPSKEAIRHEDNEVPLTPPAAMETNLSMTENEPPLPLNVSRDMDQGRDI